MEIKKGKRRFLYRFLDYREKVAKGNGWIAIVEEYLPIQKGVEVITMIFSVKVAIEPHSWVWYLTAAAIFLGYKIFWELLRIGIAMFYYKSGMWKAEIDWGAKNKKYNTFQVEQMETIRSIARQVGAKDSFKDLESD